MFLFRTEFIPSHHALWAVAKRPRENIHQVLDTHVLYRTFTTCPVA
jgi:hypothetical protein